MKTIKKSIPSDLRLYEPVIFLPDDIMRSLDHTMWKIEKSLLEFARLSNELKN